MTSYESWWIDESPPGPVPLSETEEFGRVLHSVGKQFGKTMNQYMLGIETIGTALAKTAETAVETVLAVYGLQESVKKSPSKHGPRSGSQFDHRGRRRW